MNNNNQDKSMNSMKKSLTLDLNAPNKLYLNSLGLCMSPEMGSEGIIDTPDVDTPTIESIILANNLPNTPSPSLLFPKHVTAEQETFVGGFVDALKNLHNSTLHDSDSNVSTIFNEQSGSFVPLIKEEPQTVPNVGGASPPHSPVDMAYQERLKLERKRQRNRLAASKCRSRKLERISKLEDKVKLLKNENTDLGTVVNQLKEHVGLLKLEVMEHANAGCPIVNLNAY